MNIDSLLTQIKERYLELKNSDEKNEFVNHLNSLTHWNNDSMDYPEIKEDSIEFPKEIYISYAVCHPQCGTQEFIVDGSTQECQHCGSLLFRTVERKYKLEEKEIPPGH